MRRLAILVVSAALLAGCAAAPAGSGTSSAAATPESTVQSEPAPAQAAPTGTAAEQTAVLDGFVSYGADTAGGSLKTAKAAATLVEYLSASDLEVDVMNGWLDGLSDDERELLALNWPGILSEAAAICTDPAAQADELAAAGVTTDFPGMDLTAVPDKLVTVNTVLGDKAG